MRNRDNILSLLIALTTVWHMSDIVKLKKKTFLLAKIPWIIGTENGETRILQF